MCFLFLLFWNIIRLTAHLAIHVQLPNMPCRPLSVFEVTCPAEVYSAFLLIQATPAGRQP